MKKQPPVTTYDQIKQVLLLPEFFLEEENITLTADLTEDLGLDSMDRVALAMELETAFHMAEEISVEESDDGS
ncbi:MAG TPA: phosphopantetheine-binding protein [Candidatus Angelobacter sp.]